MWGCGGMAAAASCLRRLDQEGRLVGCSPASSVSSLRGLATVLMSTALGALRMLMSRLMWGRHGVPWCALTLTVAPRKGAVGPKRARRTEAPYTALERASIGFAASLTTLRQSP